jgi:glycosyltransferase involved in cell wall biosynthesis
MLEPTDFIGYPVGGQTSFAMQMMDAFGDRLALVGLSCDDTPVGKWVDKDFNGINYKFLAVGTVNSTAKKPLIPLRIVRFLQFLRHHKAIMSLGIRNVFTQAPEALLAIFFWEWKSICFYFAAIENILRMPRYRWAKYFASLYESLLCKALRRVEVILAAADEREIYEFVTRTREAIPTSRIIKFPTRVDTKIFHPYPKDKARELLKLSPDATIVISCARINRRKGWDLVLDAFQIYNEQCPTSQLVFVGDGEDRPVLEEAILKRNLTRCVSITGFQTPSIIALYNSACDMFLNGSHFEGWPIAQLEAIACGATVVSTDVSGTRDLIICGKNGFVVQGRDPRFFAKAMLDATQLTNPSCISVEIADRYAVSGLARDLGKLWTPLVSHM